MLRSFFYAHGMRMKSAFYFAILVSAFGLSSCVEEPEKKPKGPTSASSQIPWNTPTPGSGQGQFGLLEQNRYRR